MHKRITACFILAAGALSSFAAFAGLTGDKVYAEARPALVRGQNIAISTDNALTTTDTIALGELLFQIKIEANEDTNIALTGGNRTIIFNSGAIRGYNANPDLADVYIHGRADESFDGSLTNDMDYKPITGNQSSSNNVILIGGKESHIINIVSDDDEDKFFRPGNYIFDFEAQAYTE